MLPRWFERAQARGEASKKAASLKLRKDELESFMELLEVPTVCNYLSHQKTMSPAVLKLLRTNQWLVLSKAWALIPSLCQPEFRRIFDDVLRMIEDVSQLQNCATTAALQRLHDNLVDELNESRGTKLIRDHMGNPKPIPLLLYSQLIRSNLSPDKLI